MNVTGLTGEDLKAFDFDLHISAEQRAYVTQDGLRAIAANSRVVARLYAARDRAHRDAVTNLARYKFSNFGYHAARWVTLNALIGDRQPNPFREFVELARSRTAKLVETSPSAPAGGLA